MFPKWFSKIRRPLAVLALVAGIGASALAFASEDPELPRPWPERFLRMLQRAGDRAVVELSSAIFDNLDKLDVEIFKFGGESKLGVEIRRDVLDNFDLLNTYTVIDRARVRVESRPLSSLTTWTEDVQTVGLGAPYVGVVFEPQASIEWLNVRQVKALDFRKEPSAKRLREDAERFGLAPRSGTSGESVASAPSPLPSPIPDPDLSELNPDVPLAFMDPSIRARFSKIPNLVTFPFRVPLHRADVSRMKDGEVLGYAFDGQIEVGVSAGLKVIPTLNVLHAGIDLRGTVLLHGRYQISVLRENERYARVKLTRLVEKGRKASVRVGIERKGVYDGMMVFKGTPIEQEHFLKYDANFVPFNFETSRIRANQFDVVYRYDLAKDAAKKAYHLAVLGKFGESEKLCGGVTGDPLKPVERLLSRESARETRTGDVKVDLAGVLRLDYNAKKEALEATLDLPDGTHHVLEAVRERKKRRRSLFGATNETRTRRMTLYMDAEKLAQHDPEGVFVITEITEEDSDTKARELNRTIERLERFLRKPDLLPSVPKHIPGRRNPKRERNAWYGRSSFYYGYSLSLEEIGAFLRTDRAVVEVAARKHFGEDEANRFLGAWTLAAATLARDAPYPDLFAALKGLFANRFSIEPLTDVVFDATPSRLVDYFVTAQNVGFGRVQERGKTITSVEKALTLTDRELGFDTYAQRLKQDSDAVVKNLRIEALPSGLRRIRFELPHDPANVFFRLFQVTGYKKQRRIAEFVVNNRNHRFKYGENVLVLDPASTDLATAKLARDLHRSEFYNLSVAYSRADDKYGPVSSARFEVTRPYPSRQRPGEPAPTN